MGGKWNTQIINKIKLFILYLLSNLKVLFVRPPVTKIIIFSELIFIGAHKFRHFCLDKKVEK